MGDIYRENGYEDRDDYLLALASEYGLSLRTVKMSAAMLGSDEDFDGLVTELEDYEESEMRKE